MSNEFSKQTIRTEEDKKNITTRLHKLIGQLNGIEKMIEQDRYCQDVLIQLSAVEKGVKSLASLIIDKHLHTCVIKNIKEGNEQVMDELSDLFKKFQ